MIYQLLYRLLLQRLKQYHYKQRLPEAKANLAVPYQQQETGQADKHRMSKRLTLVVVLAGVFALGWPVFKFTAPKSMPSTDHAELRLQISSSNTWPLVVYLQGADLARPETFSAALPVGKIESTNGMFTPVFQVLPAAGTLELINRDATAHNTHVFNRGETIFNVALPLAGRTVRKPLTGSGIFSVRCDLHPWMKAWLFVPPSRYYAVLYEPDTVSFTDLPPGQYVLHLWQANSSEQFRLISLTGNETKVLRLR